MHKIVSFPISTYIIFSLLLIFLFQETSAQEGINLDEFELDTIIQVSPTDPSIVDTLIVARKKVVLKKEVIVEEVQYVDAVFSKISTSFQVGPCLYLKPENRVQFNDYDGVYSKPNGYIVSPSIDFTLWKQALVSTSFIYSWGREYQNFHVPWIAEYEHQVADSNLIETYFLETSSGTAQIDVYDYFKRDTIITENRTDSISEIISTKQFQAQIGIGKIFLFKHFTLTPSALLNFRKPINPITYTVENRNAILHNLPSEITICYGLGLNVDKPINPKMGIRLSAKFLYLKEKESSLKHYSTALYSITGGFYIKIL